MTPPNIPLVYRLWHLWIEPVFAINGSRYLWSQPMAYHDFMPPTSAWHAESQVVYDQLAATYLLFAFNQAVVLRVVHDVFIWKTLILGMALSDVGHVYSIWSEMGTQIMFSPSAWRAQDWVTWVSTVGPLFLRLAFVLGVGLGHDARKRN